MGVAGRGLAGRRRSPIGWATAILPRALLAAPFLLLPLGLQPGPVLPLLVGLGVGWGVMVVPLLAAGPGALAASLLPSARVEPGLGIANLLLYLGEGGATAGLALGLLTAVIAAMGAIAALRSRAAAPRTYALAGALLLAGLLAAPASSPHDLVVPGGPAAPRRDRRGTDGLGTARS